mgnify:CR=1 FL=1
MSKEIKNSIDYIRNKTQDTSGFSTPENYFDTVEDVLFSKLIEQQLPNEDGFKVSANYFNDLETSLYSKIDFPKKEIKVIPLRKRIIRYIPHAAAASVLLFFGLNYFSLTNTSSFEDVSSLDIENWIDNEYVDFNTFNIVFVDSDFTENDLIEDETISDEDLLDYLSTINSAIILTETES